MLHQVGLGSVRKSYAPSGWTGWWQEEQCHIRLGWVEAGRAMLHQVRLGRVSQEELCSIRLGWVVSGRAMLHQVELGGGRKSNATSGWAG